MTSPSSKLRISPPLLYLVIVAVIFVCGTLFGLIVLGRWLFPPAPATPELALATATVAPAGAGPATAPPPAAQPGATQPPHTQPLVSPPPGTPCGEIPVSWERYTVQAGDTLSELAERAGISQERLLQANCLASPELWAGQQIYLPPALTPTPCTPAPPADWTTYTVQEGDTLFSLAAVRGTTAAEVMRVNCLPSEEIAAGQPLYLPPAPCVPSPPAGWELVTVRAGDTLFGLAAARGTSVEEVTRVNCLTSADLVAGQQLHLPALPAPVPTAPAPAPQVTLPAAPGQAPAPAGPPPAAAQPPAAVAQPSDLSARGDLLGLSLWSGAPYDPDQGPCESGVPEELEFGTPWIWAEKKRDLIRGDRAYFFACDFITWTPVEAKTRLEWEAQVTGPGGKAYPLEVRFYLPPDEDRDMRWANGVVVWNATCDLPPGPYTLTIKMLDDGVLMVEDDIPKQATYTFGMTMTTTKRILTVPPAAPAGAPVQVYCCNYEPGSLVKVDVFSQAARQPYTYDELFFWRHVTTLPVPINRGDEWGAWGTIRLTTAPNDAGVAYLLKDHDRYVREDVFWLLR